MSLINEHSCRIRDPESCKKGTYGRYKTNTKGLSIITAQLKKTNKTVIQSYRYKKADWTTTRAPKHCNVRGGSFEGASVIKNATLVADHTFFHLAWTKAQKTGEWKGWTTEEIITAHAAITKELKKSGVKVDRGTKLDIASDDVMKCVTSSDIPGLLEPGGQTIFQQPQVKEKKKKKKDRYTKRIELEDKGFLQDDEITEENLQEIGFTTLYNTHRKMHQEKKVDKKRSEKHGLVVDEIERRNLIHSFWGELDLIYKD